MTERMNRLAPDEIERLAEKAGLPLTASWREDLAEGSVFALWAKERLRQLDARGEAVAADGTRECPPKR